MASKIRLFLAAFFLAGQATVEGQERTDPSKGVCKAREEASRHCRWIDGTVSIYNGTPSIRIRQRKTGKMFAAGPAEQEWMPADLKSKLTIDNAIEARLKICPLGRAQRKGLPVVCIDEARVRKVIRNP